MVAVFERQPMMGFLVDWDAATRQERRRVELSAVGRLNSRMPGDPVQSRHAALSAGGAVLAYRDEDMTAVRVWDASAGREIAQLNAGGPRTTS